MLQKIGSISQRFGGCSQSGARVAWRFAKEVVMMLEVEVMMREVECGSGTLGVG